MSCFFSCSPLIGTNLRVHTEYLLGQCGGCWLCFPADLDRHAAASCGYGQRMDILMKSQAHQQNRVSDSNSLGLVRRIRLVLSWLCKREVVITELILSEVRVVELGREKDRCTLSPVQMNNGHIQPTPLATDAFPAANHTGPKEFRTLLRRQPRLIDWIVSQKLVEFWNKLLELAEHEEGTVFGPFRTGDVISSLSNKDLSCGDKRLAQFWSLESIHSWVRDPIQKAEICGQFGVMVEEHRQDYSRS